MTLVNIFLTDPAGGAMEPFIHDGTTDQDTGVGPHRRVGDERNQWAGELRQLRRALEMQSELLSEREAALQASGRHPAPAISAGAVAAAAPATDPVLEAVREQFQKLQSDRIQRRNGGKKPGRQGVA